MFNLTKNNVYINILILLLKNSAAKNTKDIKNNQ